MWYTNSTTALSAFWISATIFWRISPVPESRSLIWQPPPFLLLISFLNFSQVLAECILMYISIPGRQTVPALLTVLLDGTVDLALTGQNTGDDSCVFIPFCQDNMVIATPVNDHYLNLKQKEQPVVFQDFIKDPVIIREKGSGTKKEMDIFLENAGIEPSSLNVVARMNDLESIKKSIVNGLGFSILSARSVVDLQKTKQILLFPLEESAHKRSFYIVYSKNRILKSHVRQFIHYVKEYYQTV